MLADRRLAYGQTATLASPPKPPGDPELFRVRPERQADATDAQRSLMGSPTVVIMGVTIVLADLVLEAGGITLVFAVAVEVGDTVVKDIAEAVRRRKTWKDKCAEHYAKCMDTPIGDEMGNTYNESRCERCRDMCQKNEEWPTQVPFGDGYASCVY